MSNCLADFGNLMCPCSYTEMLDTSPILCFKSQILILIGSAIQYLKFINDKKQGSCLSSKRFSVTYCHC